MSKRVGGQESSMLLSRIFVTARAIIWVALHITSRLNTIADERAGAADQGECNQTATA